MTVLRGYILNILIKKKGTKHEHASHASLISIQPQAKFLETEKPQGSDFQDLPAVTHL